MTINPADLANEIQRLYTLMGPQNALTEFEVAESAARMGMPLKDFMVAVKGVARRAFDMRSGADKAGKLWKGISALGRSSSATAEFSEAVTAASSTSMFALPSAVAAATAALLGLAIGTVVVAGIGGYYWWTTDSAIKGGDQFNRPHTQQEGLLGRGEVTYRNEDYVIAVAEVSGGSIMIGQASVLKETEGCKVEGGGLCTQPSGKNPLLQTRIVQAGFKTYEAAKAAWCKTLKGAKTHPVAVAGDSKADVYGGSYWIGTAPSCDE